MTRLRLQVAGLGAWAQRHRAAVRVAFAVAIALIATAAWARPGGGGSFSGGSGGGGGGGDDDFIINILFLLLELCFDYPAVGVPLLVIAVIVFVVRAGLANTRKENANWSTASEPETPPASTRMARSALEGIRDFDEDFSAVLFEDFLYGLYAEVRYAQGRGQLAQLSAYLGKEVIDELTAERRGDVKTVIVGAMRYVGFEGVGGAAAAGGVSDIKVSVEFEANYGTDDDAVYSRDLWRLKRRRTTRSRPPGRARVFNCPSCGAPLSAVFEGTCSHCGKNVATGDFDWVVEGQLNEAAESHGPMLTGVSGDQGLSYATIVHPDAAGRLALLRSRDATFDWGSFVARLELVFQEFQVAWSARDLGGMRPFLSDLLFEEQRYWVEAYTRQRLRNVTENARLTRTQLARVTTDKYFDAITVRIFATGLDYTIDEAGARVSGSKTSERPYSEYWTLIRSTRASGAALAEKKCPNCGAPLKVNMAGVCEYCSAKVTSGDFDWVLSRIEQALAYRG